MQCTKLKTYMETGRVLFLPPSRIQPNPAQPRTTFSAGDLEELAASIRSHGILQPLSVRKKDTHYELIAGERRYRAAQMAGLREIPCIVMQMTDGESGLTALMENLQRQDLSYLEEARAYSMLMTRYCLSQSQIAQAVGKSQSAIANTLRLLRHSQPVLEKLQEHNLSQRQARALLKLPTEEQKLTAIAHIARNSLSTTQTDRYIDGLLPSPSPPCAPRTRSPSGGAGTAQAVTERVPHRPDDQWPPLQEAFLSALQALLQSTPTPITLTQEETPTHITLTLHIPK